MTREVVTTQEQWTLLTIKSCTFQANATMQALESADVPVDGAEPSMIITKFKIYDYTSTDGQGLWALSPSPTAIVTIDDNSSIAESASGVLRSLKTADGKLSVDAGAIDTITGALEVVDYAHHEVHAGTHYNYLDTHTLAKNGVIDHMVVTPDTDKFAHFYIGVETTTSSILLAMYEGTTYSDPGTVEPMINRNRNFADDNTTELYETPTITSDGTRLLQITLGAGKNSDGGGSRDDMEIVLKRNTAYLIRVTEQNVASTVVNLKFDWYEHSNRI